LNELLKSLALQADFLLYTRVHKRKRKLIKQGTWQHPLDSTLCKNQTGHVWCTCARPRVRRGGFFLQSS